MKSIARRSVSITAICPISLFGMPAFLLSANLLMILILSIGSKKMISEKTKTALKELARSVLAALVAFVTTLLSVSCGSTTKVLVHDTNQATSITISQTNSNSSEVNPDVKVELNPVKNQ